MKRVSRSLMIWRGVSWFAEHESIEQSEDVLCRRGLACWQIIHPTRQFVHHHHDEIVSPSSPRQWSNEVHANHLPRSTRRFDRERESLLASSIRLVALTLIAATHIIQEGQGRIPARSSQEAIWWGAEQQRAFEQLKAAVVSAPCLAIPDPQRDFIVHTDASGYATGAVLMQQFDDGLRPIAFLSKKMTKAERNYPVHEQELLAILNALKAWRHYPGGRRFTVLTDHQSLQYVETSAMATPRQVRWAAWLSEFDFWIKYSPGKNNVAADALSRGAAGSGSQETAATASGDSQELAIGSLSQQQQQQQHGNSGERLLLSAINDLAPLPVRICMAAAADADFLPGHSGALCRCDGGEEISATRWAVISRWRPIGRS